MSVFFVTLFLGIVLELLDLHYLFVTSLFLISVFQYFIKSPPLLLFLAAIPQAIRMSSHVATSVDVSGFSRIISSNESLSYYYETFQIGTAWLFGILRFFDLGYILGSVVIVLVLSLFCILCMVLGYGLWENFILLTCIDSIFAVHIFRQIVPSIILLIGIFAFYRWSEFSLNEYGVKILNLKVSKVLLCMLPLFLYAFFSHTYILFSTAIILLVLILPRSFASFSFLIAFSLYLLGPFSDPRLYTNFLVYAQSLGFGQVSMSIMMLDESSSALTPLCLFSYFVMALLIILKHSFPSTFSFSSKLFVGNAALTLPLIGVPMIGLRFGAISATILTGIPFLILRDFLQTRLKRLLKKPAGRERMEQRH